MRVGTIALLSALVGGTVLGQPATTSARTATFSPHTSQTVSPPLAYTGSAEVTYTSLPRIDLPTTASGYAGPHQATVRFAVRDQSHFRVDIQTVSPAIESGTYTEVVNGSTATSYDGVSGLAFRSTIPRKHRSAILHDLLSALESGTMEPGGLGTLPSPTKPVSAYVALLRHPHFAPPPPFHFHARIVGHETLLGRPVDVIDVSPVTVKVIGNVCNRTKQGQLCRPSRFHGSNSGRIWVDHVHPFILQYHGYGTTNVHNLGIVDSTIAYRVTSITYGQGPSDQDLQFQPPVKVVRSGTPMSFLPMGSDSGPGPGVAPPGPFVYPGPPSSGSLSVSNGIQRLGYGPHYKIANVTILFSTGAHGVSYFYKPRHLGPMSYVKGPYLFIQEQLRPGGLPPQLQAGTPQMAGTCQTWTGSYADGQQWLAFAKKKASVLISTNALTSIQLVQYVAQAMCQEVHQRHSSVVSLVAQPPLQRAAGPTGQLDAGKSRAAF